MLDKSNFKENTEVSKLWIEFGTSSCDTFIYFFNAFFYVVLLRKACHHFMAVSAAACALCVSIEPILSFT